MSADPMRCLFVVDRAKLLATQPFQCLEAKLAAYTDMVAELLEAMQIMETANENFETSALRSLGSPCELHSGDNAPAIAAFRVQLNGRCILCDVGKVKLIESQASAAGKSGSQTERYES